MADLSAQLVRGKQAAFQYKPIVSEDLSWLARTENQRNYLESQAKQKEQQDLRDQLLKLQELGLAPDVQNAVNSEVSALINKVRNGEIDPNTVEFRSAVAKLKGQATLAINLYKQEIDLAKTIGNNQIIEFDPVTGVPKDTKGDYIKKVGTGHGGNSLEEILQNQSRDITQMSNSTEVQKVDSNALNSAVDSFIKRNAEFSAEAKKFPGVSGIALIEKISTMKPEVSETWNNYVKNNYQTALISQAALASKTTGDPNAAQGVMDSGLDPWLIKGNQTKVTGIETKTITKTKDTSIPSYSVEYIAAGDQKIKNNSFEQYPAFMYGDIKVQGQPVIGVTKINGVEKAMLALTKNNKPIIQYVDNPTLVAGYKTEALKKGAADIRKAASDYLDEYEAAEMTSFDVKDELDAIVKEAAKDDYDDGYGDDEGAFQAFLEKKGYDLSKLKLDLGRLDFDDPKEMREFAKDLLENNDQLAQQKPISSKAEEVIKVEGTPDTKTWKEEKLYDYNNYIYFYDNTDKKWKSKSK